MRGHRRRKEAQDIVTVGIAGFPELGRHVVGAIILHHTYLGPFPQRWDSIVASGNVEVMFRRFGVCRGSHAGSKQRNECAKGGPMRKGQNRSYPSGVMCKTGRDDDAGRNGQTPTDVFFLIFQNSKKTVLRKKKHPDVP